MRQVAPAGRWPDDLGAPLLICTNLQKNHLVNAEASSGESLKAALMQCRSLLEQWRDNRWPVAHLKRVAQVFWFGGAMERADWMEVFEPQPGELAFEHALPSAYSSARFAEFMRCVLPVSHFVIGCSLEDTILSTVIDGYHRGHRHCVVEDASVCGSPRDSSSNFDRSTLLGVVGNFGSRISRDTLVQNGRPPIS